MTNEEFEALTFGFIRILQRSSKPDIVTLPFVGEVLSSTIVVVGTITILVTIAAIAYVMERKIRSRKDERSERCDGL